MDLGVIVSTLISPLLAVQATRWLDERREKRRRQLGVFTTLMANRGRFLDVRHVEALNVIDVVYAGSGKSVTKVRAAWRAYQNHLEPRGLPDSVWLPRRNELFTELLSEMAQHLGLDLDKTTIGSQALYPGGWGTAESNQQRIQAGLARIMDGAAPLPVEVKIAATAAPPPAAPSASLSATPSASPNVQATAATTGANP